MFRFTCLVKHSNIPSKTEQVARQHWRKEFWSDLAISAPKYPKIVKQKEKKFQSIHDTIYQNYVFLRCFYVVFTCFCA